MNERVWIKCGDLTKSHCVLCLRCPVKKKQQCQDHWLDDPGRETAAIKTNKKIHYKAVYTNKNICELTDRFVNCQLIELFFSYNALINPDLIS